MATPRSNNGATLLALATLLAMGIGLIALSALVLPQILGLVAVVFGFFAFGAIHYLLWGWWLRPTPPESESEDAGASL